MEKSERPKKAPKLKYQAGHAALELRKSLKLNQSEFWPKIGITQSAGSRYENGRNMPTVVAMAVELVWGSERESKKLLDALRHPSRNTA